MAFEKLKSIVAGGRAGMPASVTLTCQGGGLPRFRITLSKFLAEKAEIADGDRFDLLIGSDDDRGVIQLHRNSDGVVRARLGAKGGAQFNCGHIEQFGTDSQEKQFCAAEVVDGGAIEVTLPPWAAE